MSGETPEDLRRWCHEKKLPSQWTNSHSCVSSHVAFILSSCDLADLDKNHPGILPRLALKYSDSETICHQIRGSWHTNETQNLPLATAARDAITAPEVFAPPLQDRESYSFAEEYARSRTSALLGCVNGRVGGTVQVWGTLSNLKSSLPSSPRLGKGISDSKRVKLICSIFCLVVVRLSNITLLPCRRASTNGGGGMSLIHQLAGSWPLHHYQIRTCGFRMLQHLHLRKRHALRHQEPRTRPLGRRHELEPSL